MKGREGSVNVMGRKGGNRLFPTLTLTLTFHHPEQSLLHKLHWLDHVIRVGVFSVSVFVARALTTCTNIYKHESVRGRPALTLNI